MNLFSTKELPDGFTYPAAFERVVDLGLTNLEPWHITLDVEFLRARVKGFRERYPYREIVPFAHRQDNDDVACWQVDRPGEVLIIHDFASPGYELNEEFPSFEAWFKSAIDAMFEWAL